MSSLEGVESPLGWLCDKIIEAELLKIAGLKISLGCTKELFNVPMLTTLISVSWFYVRNAQWDIIQLLNQSGAPVASHTYDSWGKHKWHYHLKGRVAGHIFYN